VPAEEPPQPPASDQWVRHVLADVAAQEENSGFSSIDAFFAAAKRHGAPFDAAVAYYKENTIASHVIVVRAPSVAPLLSHQ
jgi:hypothetical protein